MVVGYVVEKVIEFSGRKNKVFVGIELPPSIANFMGKHREVKEVM